jgi:hypothetical protein
MCAKSSVAPLTMVIADKIVVGHLIRRGIQGFEAFDVADKSLGIFDTQHTAAAALMKEGEP